MIEAEKLGSDINYSDWITGALTGYNAATGGSLGRGMDFESIAVWTRNYCRAHPLDYFVQAFGSLVEELKKRASK